MHRTALLFATITFLLVGAASYFMASQAVGYVERATKNEVSTALNAAGQDWATIRADGLVLHLTGLAPNEAARFRALETIGQFVETKRIQDKTTILETSGVEAPRFSLEVLRNVDRISLIGLIPEKTGRDGILQTVQAIAQVEAVTDMLESADHPIPSGWDAALDFGLDSLNRLPRSKISISANRVKVTAVTDSPKQQRNVEAALTADKPDDVTLVLDISAPRPVISPFKFRLVLTDGTARMTACSADTPNTRDRILRSVAKLSTKEKLSCQIGLGIPTTDWANAIRTSVETLQELGSGTLTFTDTDVALIVPSSLDQATFDAVVGKLEVDLPELFSLHAVLPPRKSENASGGLNEVPEFSATRSPEGTVQLRGRVSSELTRDSIGTYANALFGSENTFNQTRIDATLPDGWPARVLASLEALSNLDRGSVNVQADQIDIKGVAGPEETPAEISRIFAVRIGGTESYNIDVEIDPTLVPVETALLPLECARQVNAILANQQIQFAPSSSTIEPTSQGILDAIAEVLRDCRDTEFEVAGFTDSQGREEMNLNLSQSRAEAVLAALLQRKILTNNMSPKGYGEANPIADNGTEEGRAKNRRIEFILKEESEETDE